MTKPFEWYQREMPVALPGMKADATVDVIDSYAAEIALDPGAPVIRGTDAANQIQPAAAAGDGASVIGIAVHTHKAYEGTGAYYEEGYNVPVMSFGDVYVEVGGSVVAGGTVGVAFGADGAVFCADGATVVTGTTAGSNTYTVTANAAAGDTVSFGGVTLTAGAATGGFAVGASAAATAANIASALAADTTISNTYTVTASGPVITVTETNAGGGDTPGAMTATGTLAITAGTAVTSATTTATSEPVSGMTYLQDGADGDVVIVRVRK